MSPYVRTQIDNLATETLLQETLASEAAELAALARDEGNEGFSAAVLSLSRHHRVSALQLRGQLAALAEVHPHALDGDD
jgi:hypothetical protein